MNNKPETEGRMKLLVGAAIVFFTAAFVYGQSQPRAEFEVVFHQTIRGA